MARGFLGQRVNRMNLDFISKGYKVDLTQNVSLQNLEEVIVKVHQRIVSEPAHKIVLYKILAFCQVAHSLTDITEEVLSYPEIQGSLQPVSVLLSWLIECGGVEEVVVAGMEGNNLELRTTVAGKAVLDKENSSDKFSELFAREPNYYGIYIQLLATCISPKTRAEIEAMLKGNPILESPKVYANYFIETLETIGGLEWRDKWQTTHMGMKVVNESRFSDMHTSNFISND